MTRVWAGPRLAVLLRANSPVAGAGAGAVPGNSAAPPARAALAAPDAVADESRDYRKENEWSERVDMPHIEHQAPDQVPDEEVDDQATDAGAAESQVRRRKLRGDRATVRVHNAFRMPRLQARSGHNVVRSSLASRARRYDKAALLEMMA